MTLTATVALHPAVTHRRRLSQVPAAGRSVSLPAIAGVVLVLGGVVMPWVRVPVGSALHATALPVVAGPATVSGAVSYGAVTIVLLGIALVALVRSRGRSGAVSSLAGAGIAAMALLFVVYTVLGDAQLSQRLVRQQAEMDAIGAHFGYPIGGGGPNSLLLLPLTGTWHVVAASLRLGWLASVTGGVLLATGGGRGALRQVRAHPWRWAAAGSAATAAVLATLVPCIAANLLIDSGIAATRTGDHSTAADRLRLASRLDPRVSARADYEIALGESSLEAGDRTSALSLLAQAQVLESDHQEVSAATILRQALAVDPGNPVLVDNLGQVARDLIWSHADPRTMTLLLGQTYGDRPANHYAMGRYLYLHGDFDNAILQMDHVLALTTDSNVDSSALTYIALGEYHEGDTTDARRHILQAVAIDSQYNNDLARDLATGLYTFGDV
jgi:hypothetical protein